MPSRTLAQQKQRYRRNHRHVTNSLFAEAGNLLKSGNFAAAKVLLQKLSAEAPDNAEVWHNLAVSLARLGDLPAARDAVGRAIALQANNSRFLLLAANIHQDTGQVLEALAFADRIQRSQPGFAQARNLAGILLADLGRHAESETAFRAATEVDPQYVQAFGNLATACLQTRKSKDALEAARRAITLQPNYANAYHVAASALLQLGETAQAIESLQLATRLQPEFADAWLLLARIYRQQQAIQPALESLQRALAIAPAKLDAQIMLGELYSSSGDIGAAHRTYAHILAQHPNHLETATRQALLLPVAYAGADEIVTVRNNLARALEELTARQREFDTLPPTDRLRQIQYSNFYLAYQGKNDLALQCRFAAFQQSVLKPILPTYFQHRAQKPVAGRRVRVGFASRFFYDSTAGNYFARWVTDLDRAKFEVHVFYTHTSNDQLTAQIRARADVFAPFEPDFAALAKQIADSDLDILVYPELGMDAKVFTLAALRLAPVQVCGWGHPVTTGHNSIDYFLSCAAMEPDDAAQHYHERLALLPGLGTRYVLPSLSRDFQSQQRADYQLPVDKNLYLVPQSLFKIHPDNDTLLVEIVAHDPDGVLVFFAGQAVAAQKIFMARLMRAFAAKGLSTQGRVKILPDVSHADYQRINALCDVMLDTLHWSGGNTSLEALAFGLPIVTLPGEFMRGRQSMAMLQLMRLEELIAKNADEYVMIATGIGRNAERRRALSQRIFAAHTKLFDDPTPTAAFAEFLLQATKAPVVLQRNQLTQ